MRAAYLARPRAPESRSSELPSESSGAPPEIIEVAPDTDWMSSFPEERSKLWVVVPRDGTAPAAPPVDLPLAAPPYIPVQRGPSLTDYWPHAVAVAIVGTLVMISTGILSGPPPVNRAAPNDGVQTASQPSVAPPASRTPPERPTTPARGAARAASRALEPPGDRTTPPVATTADLRRTNQKPAAPARTPVASPPSSQTRGATSGRPAERTNAPAARNSGDLPVRNPVVPITSPIPARSLPGTKEPPPPSAPTLPVTGGTTAATANAGAALATPPAVPPAVRDSTAKPPVPTPAPSPVSSPAAPPPPSAREVAIAGVRQVIEHYRSAYSNLNVAGISAFWPSVNTRALARAFEQLEAQRFDFDNCQVDASAQTARAICTGTAHFVTKVGSKTPRAEPRRWTFQLSRSKDGWIIERVESR